MKRTTHEKRVVHPALTIVVLIIALLAASRSLYGTPIIHATSSWSIFMDTLSQLSDISLLCMPQRARIPFNSLSHSIYVTVVLFISFLLTRKTQNHQSTIVILLPRSSSSILGLIRQRSMQLLLIYEARAYVWNPSHPTTYLLTPLVR